MVPSYVHLRIATNVSCFLKSLHPHIGHSRHSPVRKSCHIRRLSIFSRCLYKPIGRLKPFVPRHSCLLAVTANSDPALSMRAPRRVHLAFRAHMCQQAKPRRQLTARTGRQMLEVNVVHSSVAGFAGSHNFCGPFGTTSMISHCCVLHGQQHITVDWQRGLRWSRSCCS